MKSSIVMMATAVAIALFGCGGVDVGGIPVDANGMTNNFSFGDINVGGIDGLGSAVEEATSAENAGEEPAEEIGEKIKPEAHPADADGDFVLTGGEILAYSQDQGWVDAAVAIWQARYDGAYYDDMETPRPGNWRPVEDSADSSAGGADSTADVDTVVDVDINIGTTESEEAGTEAAQTGGGYDLLVQASSLSTAAVRLTVVDPNEQRDRVGVRNRVGWRLHGQGLGERQLERSERITFSLRAYVSGALVHDGEHSAWSGLTAAPRAAP